MFEHLDYPNGVHKNSSTWICIGVKRDVLRVSWLLYNMSVRETFQGSHCFDASSTKNYVTEGNQGSREQSIWSILVLLLLFCGNGKRSVLHRPQWVGRACNLSSVGCPRTAPLGAIYSQQTTFACRPIRNSCCGLLASNFWHKKVGNTVHDGLQWKIVGMYRISYILSNVFLPHICGTARKHLFLRIFSRRNGHIPSGPVLNKKFRPWKLQYKLYRKLFPRRMPAKLPFCISVLHSFLWNLNTSSLRFSYVTHQGHLCF